MSRILAAASCRASGVASEAADAGSLRAQPLPAPEPGVLVVAVPAEE
jgi:hypothetical protein